MRSSVPAGRRSYSSDSSARSVARVLVEEIGEQREPVLDPNGFQHPLRIERTDRREGRHLVRRLRGIVGHGGEVGDARVEPAVERAHVVERGVRPLPRGFLGVGIRVIGVGEVDHLRERIRIVGKPPHHLDALESRPSSSA